MLPRSVKYDQWAQWVYVTLLNTSQDFFDRVGQGITKMESVDCNHTTGFNWKLFEKILKLQLLNLRKPSQEKEFQ